ncbi:hypothetical protein JXR01_01480 [Candidatus Kaiserbacteria bacterium]|nr:MAG: hypothetical protein JXR01_01480 [Candidatus Kaiserbacteria bacterium]
MSEDQKLPSDALRLKDIVELTALVIAEVFGEGRLGGCFHARYADGTVLLPKLIAGQPNQEKLEKYIEFATKEKPERLLRHPKHILSWQSRNPSLGRWGGAINLSRGTQSGVVLAFSGFPEMVDEAYCMAIGVQMGWVSESGALEIMKISSNADLFPKVNYVVKETMTPFG